MLGAEETQKTELAKVVSLPRGGEVKRCFVEQMIFMLMFDVHVGKKKSKGYCRQTKVMGPTGVQRYLQCYFIQFQPITNTVICGTALLQI